MVKFIIEIALVLLVSFVGSAIIISLSRHDLQYDETPENKFHAKNI